MKWPFMDIFSFSVNKISDFAEQAEADQALQKSLRKPWLQSNITLYG